MRRHSAFSLEGTIKSGAEIGNLESEALIVAISMALWDGMPM